MKQSQLFTESANFREKQIVDFLKLVRKKHLVLFPDDIKRLSYEYYLNVEKLPEDEAHNMAAVFTETWKRFDRNLISYFIEYNDPEIVAYILKNA